jgi:hypothetical protein
MLPLLMLMLIIVIYQTCCCIPGNESSGTGAAIALTYLAANDSPINENLRQNHHIVGPIL